jgi:Na+/H+-dicarboxylate symporter
MLAKYRNTPLWARILAALVAGAVVGVIAGPSAAAIKPVGDLFINAIRMLIVPLIFFSLVCGVMSLKDPAKLGRIGGKTIGLYLITTMVAVILGLLVGALLQPGAGLKLERSALQAPNAAAAPSFLDTLLKVVPTNPVDALARGDVLQIIVFSILLGLAITYAGERAAPVARVFEAGNEVIMRLVMMIMEIAPFGVFALMAWVAGTYGIGVLLPLAALILAVYLACLLHAFVTLGGVLVGLIGRLNPLSFFKGASEPGIVAFTTTSSNATLPVTMEAAEKKLGISNGVASFTLPLGATINMDGTCIYQGIAALFVAQAFGIDLSFGQYATIVMTATLASIGTAGVPGAGLIMTSMVLQSVGLPLEGIAIIAGIDRILDMARTSVNVTGDVAVSLIIAKSEGEFDPAVYYGTRPAEAAPIAVPAK